MLLTLIVDAIFMVVGAFFMAAWYERKIRLIRRENLNKNIKRWKAGYDAGVRHGRRMSFFRPVRDVQLPENPNVVIPLKNRLRNESVGVPKKPLVYCSARIISLGSGHDKSNHIHACSILTTRPHPEAMRDDRPVIEHWCECGGSWFSFKGES